MSAPQIDPPRIGYARPESDEKASFRSLFLENPMLIEFRRGVRRFFGVSKLGAVNGAVLVVSVLLYGLLLLIVAANREGMSPIAIVLFQTFLYCIIVPASLHGAIAGERERRTWEMLMVAPISNLKIIIGKLLGGVCTLFVVVILMLPPIIMSFAGDPESSFFKLVRAEMISIGFGIFLAAVSIFISSRSKRAYGAHLLIYTYLVVTLIVYPLFVEVAHAGGSAENGRSFWLYLHPFYAVLAVWNPTSVSASPFYYNGAFHFLVFVLIAVLLCAITIETLQVTDGEPGRRR